MNLFKRRLRLLREEMKGQGIEAYIIPCTDPHLGENIPDHWRIVQWLTGFTGSAATVVVSKAFAGLWTDSRYFLQAEKELDGSGFTLMKFGVRGGLTVNEWLSGNLKKGGIVAFDGRLISTAKFREMRDSLKSRQTIFSTDTDLVTGLWENRPALPDSVAYEHDLEFAGVSREMKLERVRHEMERRNVSHHLLNRPEDIMWLLNIRGNDVKYSPLLLCRVLVGPDQVLLFTDEIKLPLKLAAEFDRHGIVVLPYDEINGLTSALPQDSTILLSEDEIPVALYDSLPPGIEIKNSISIPSRLKAIKNLTERENIRKVMVRDGVALTRFFMWLENNLATGSITEESAARKLLELRLQQANCTGESFAPVIALNEHAALPHYSCLNGPGTIIRKSGILLVDSGGQYLDGTTDVTRCMALGPPTQEMKNDFTMVLKGTISLARARFPLGTRGSQLDILARKALWDKGLNYGHGTGHGVGFFLGVHEAPPVISPAGEGRFNLPLQEGMIVSDEPALYREGRYGFRTENLIMVIESEKTDYGQFMEFETLTLCYIDLKLVERSLLGEDEITWLNAYHSEICRKLSGFLTEEERSWLREKTGKI